MARRSTRKTTLRTNPVTLGTEEGSPVAPAPDPTPSASTAGARSNRVILIVALSVFTIFMITIFAFFSTGTEIRWKKELARADRLYAERRYADAARAIAQFGQDYPGARATYDWNRKMGLYHGAAGDFQTSATYYLAASQISPREPGIHALAGEALWKAGKFEESVTSLRQEIERIPRATGDHDRANLYLGKYLILKEQYPEAMQHFEAISNRDQWRAELDDVYRQVEVAVLEPARNAATSASQPERGGS